MPINWSVQIFQTTTGRIVNNDLPVSDFPQFSRIINNNGSWQVKLLLGDKSLGFLADLRQTIAPFRYSIAVCYGQYIAQAGPIVTTQLDDTTGTLTITGGDFWTLLKYRVIWNSSFPPAQTTAASLLPMDTARDVNLTSLDLPSIAASLVTNATARTGFSLPVDIPSTNAGTAIRQYPVYDLATVYTRLTDLVGVQGGPDVDFSPYFDLANPGFIRWKMNVGNPLLNATKLFYFDYGSSCRVISIDSDASNMASAVYAKGNATERASQVAYSVNSTLVTAGWPAMEYVDTGHTSATDLTTIQGYADGDLGLFAKPVEVWHATVNVLAASAAFGSYDPGSIGVFNIPQNGHSFIPAGSYAQRILGFTQSDVATVKLLLQATQGSL